MSKKPGAKPKLLLHICCGPDATQVIKLLEQNYEVAGYFYNPNIQPREEYEKRLLETERLFNLWNLKLYKGEYDTDTWLQAIKGFENEPEGGRRCEVCFAFRLRQAARFAHKHGFDSYTTTLTISPHKNAELINRLGQNFTDKRGLQFLTADFKKQDGFKKSIALSKDLGLFRQDYCGCSYSKQERDFFKLSKTIKSCKRCTVPKESYPIFSGKWNNRVMLVGQAPGKKELTLGKPFSGPAGKRLFQWLGKAGFDEVSFRNTVYMTAVMKCFPGSAPHGDRKPSSEELATCAPYLEQEIALIRPRVLIPVGQLAIQRFLGVRPLDQVVGKKFNALVAGQECIVIPLPHPSGASPWSFQKENRLLLRKALRLVKNYFHNEYKIGPQRTQSTQRMILPRKTLKTRRRE